MSTYQNNSIILNPFICPICNATPEIKDVHPELGKIIIKCNCGQNKEWEVDEYLRQLEQTGKISPLSYKQQSKEIIDDNSTDNIINENAKNISDIIRLNQLIDLTQRKYPNNYYHNISLINLGKSIENENKIPNNINEAINSVLKEDNIVKEEQDAIEKLQYYTIFLDNQVKKLIIKGEKEEKKYRWLRNDGFELISKIKFKHLIELNLSRNGITSVSYLDNMLLPHLKILNLSQNLIEDIKPVAELLSENMREIFLQENQIEDIGDFKNSNFKKLFILRVDKNNINYNSNTFKEVRKIYKEKLVYKSINIEQFNKKYDFDYDEKNKHFDLSSKRRGDEIIIDFSCLINSSNNIISLILDDNKLQNVSLLNRMPLFHLEILDLSLNLITDIKFLKKLSKKCKLQKLYLNDNKIMDITPLVNYSDKNDKELIFKELQILTLKQNSFYQKHHFINDEALDITICLAEKLKEGFDFDLKELKKEKESIINKKNDKLKRIKGDTDNANNNDENNINNN